MLPSHRLAAVLVTWYSFALLTTDCARAAFLNRGDVVVTSATFGGVGVYRVDPISGDRTLLSGAGRGSGPGLIGPPMLAQGQDGSLLVTDYNTARVIRIDPETGDRTVVSQHPYLSTDTTSVGVGPYFIDPVSAPDWLSFVGASRAASIVIEPNQNVLALAPNGLFRVDPATGDRTLLSNTSFGSGPMWGIDSLGFVRTPSGDVYVADVKGRALSALSCRPEIAPSSPMRVLEWDRFFST